jgi:hypothetical protein
LTHTLFVSCFAAKKKRKAIAPADGIKKKRVLSDHTYAKYCLKDTAWMDFYGIGIEEYKHNSRVRFQVG